MLGASLMAKFALTKALVDSQFKCASIAMPYTLRVAYFIYEV